ncbi:dihydroflavonol-4-reductase [Moesziomyces antarcticus]|uniref:Dihydroflavonol-4-reductase n=1 Tax=Pseudozyma antarctica TaxID=84753 RepID=A0A081CP32_PSEA2|nr:dihydroflavonol-4-reductase [Moesziomyces antarcticus]GAK68428.1 dihydroflavonol-4-reductase [Moesziomyces antarcticus]
MSAQELAQELFLVTGANGYIAAALVRQLLQDGKHVRATVRRQQAGDDLRAALPASTVGRLGIAIVPDIIAPNAFRVALQGEGKTDAKRDYLDPAKLGVLSLLEDASHTPSVRKVVLTASIASIMDVRRANTDGSFTEKDWNPITYDYAIELGAGLANGKTSPMTIYAASKALAERAAWEFVHEHKPSFAFAAVHPGFVVGRPVTGSISGSNGMLWQTLTARPVQESAQPMAFVDLEDTVRGHLQAMQRKEADGGRFLLVAGQPLTHEAINWAKDRQPDLPFDRVDIPADAEERKRKFTGYDNSASRDVLGI